MAMQLSARLERAVGEPVRDEPSKQAKDFLRLCIQENLDDDQIVVLARRHQPTKDAWEGDSEDVVERLLPRLRAEVSSFGPSGPPYLDWARGAATTFEPRWAIDSWIERGDSVALVGPPKIGKSLLTLEAAACKAAGASFLGHRVTPGPVLYLDWENRPEAVFRRLRHMAFSAPDLADLRYLCFPQMSPLDTAAGSAEIIKQVRDTGAELVVIDTLQRVLSGEENSSLSIRDLYRHLLMPLRADGVAVLRLDHLGKGDQRTARGSSAKGDDVDQVWLLRPRSDDLFDLRRTLSRTDRGVSAYVLRRLATPLRHVVVDGVGRRDDEESRQGGERGVAAATEMIHLLDALRLPDRIGRPSAIRALREAGYSYSTSVLSDALKVRQSRSRTA